MSPWQRLLLIVCLALCALSPARSAPPPASNEKEPRQGKTARVDRYGDPLPPGALARLGTRRFRHHEALAAVALTPDGKTVAASGPRSGVRLWEAVTGKEQARPAGYDRYRASALAFASDGARLLLATSDGVWVWDWLKEKEPRLFAGTEEFDWQKLARDAGKDLGLPLTTSIAVVSVAVSPDGRHVAWSDLNGTVRRQELRAGKEVLVAKGRPFFLPGPNHPVAFSPDSRLLAFSWDDHSIRLRDVAANKEVRRLQGHRDDVVGIAFSPDGKLLASTSTDGTLRLWATATGKHRLCLNGPQGGSVAFARDGKAVATGDDDGVIRVWSLPEGKLLWRAQGQCTGVSGLAYTPDGRTLVAVGEDEAVRRWDAATGEELGANEGHTARVWSVAFSPDGRTLASASGDATARLWDPRTGKELRRLEGHDDRLCAVTFSPDGKVVATAGFGQTVHLWETTSGKQRQLLKGMGGGVYDLAWCQGGKLLATNLGTYDRLLLWDVSSGRKLFKIEGRNPVAGLASSPGGTELAVAEHEEVTVLDLATRRSLCHILDAEASIQKVAFSPDGRLVAAASKKGSPCRVYEVASGQMVRAARLPGEEQAEPLSVVFAGRNDLLAFGTAGGSIFLWDLRSGEPAEFKGECGSILSLACSPDGKLLASGNSDTTVLIWAVPAVRSTAITPGAEPSRTELEKWWGELGGDAVTAHRAVQALASSPRSAAFLRERLRPIALQDAKVVARHVAGLASEDYRERRDALAALERLGELAVPLLQKRLGEKPSLEEARRIEELLRKTVRWRADQFQALRAIQSLEYMGTAAARQVLESLAGGAPESRLTQEAKASLRRLARKPTP